MSVEFKCMSRITHEQIISYHHCMNKLRAIILPQRRQQKEMISNRIEFKLFNTSRKSISILVTLRMENVDTPKKKLRWRSAVAKLFKLRAGETHYAEFGLVTPGQTGKYQLLFDYAEMGTGRKKQTVIVQTVERSDDNDSYLFHDTFVAWSHRSMIQRYRPNSLFLIKKRQLAEPAEKRKLYDEEDSFQEEDDAQDLIPEPHFQEKDAVFLQEEKEPYVFQEEEKPYDLQLEVDVDWILNDPELVGARQN